MTPADRHTLARKLEYLRKQLDLLEEYRKVSKDVLFGEEEKRLAVERLLELSLQSVIDCSRLLVALEDWRPIRDQRDALLILVDHDVLSESLVERLLKAKGFRNVLVHEYVEIDPDLLFSHLRHGVDDIWEFAQCLAEWLDQKRKR